MRVGTVIVSRPPKLIHNEFGVKVAPKVGRNLNQKVEGVAALNGPGADLHLIQQPQFGENSVKLIDFVTNHAGRHHRTSRNKSLRDMRGGKERVVSVGSLYDRTFVIVGPTGRWRSGTSCLACYYRRDSEDQCLDRGAHRFSPSTYRVYAFSQAIQAL